MPWDRRALSLFLGFAVVGTIVLLTTFSPGSDDNARPEAIANVDGEMNPTALQRAEPTPFPTDPDPEGDARATADAVLNGRPDLGGSSVIITATRFLTSPRPYVRGVGGDVVGLIGMAPHAEERGLGAEMRADKALRAALFEALRNEGGRFDGEDAREKIARGSGWLYMHAPERAVEDALVDRYWDELSPEVRLQIVAALGAHSYASDATRAVFVHASESSDDTMAERSRLYLDRLAALADDDS